ncbi:MAG TPA: serine/threonine-protein kinase [Ktedonobacteraceae bacterium]|nr:serine/threonine-protein kinase [Ktedonobacteraceae bacterium]
MVQRLFSTGRVVRERYLVEDLLGQGGFGAVYRVRDRRVRGNTFALKEVVSPNAQQRESFAFECDVLRRLDHPALPRVYRVFEDQKTATVSMLMDYIAGPNLERLRQQQPERRFPLMQVLQIMAPIVDAVRYLHAQQPPIIHRDIKPANIIVPDSGDCSVLVDFGIAKEYDQDSTTTAVRHCSPGYGAPEQYVYGTNTQTDIYGLGATCYTLLTGEVPVDALYRITRLSSKSDDPLVLANRRVPALPAAVGEVIQRALAVNSHDRFATVEDFWQALQACPVVAEESVEPPSRRAEPDALEAFLAAPLAPDTPSLPLPPVTIKLRRQSELVGMGKRRARWVRWLLLLLLLIALGIGIYVGWRTIHSSYRISFPLPLARMPMLSYRHNVIGKSVAPRSEMMASVSTESSDAEPVATWGVV